MMVGVVSGGKTKAGVSSTTVVMVCVITLGLATSSSGVGMAAVRSAGTRTLVVGVSNTCNIVKEGKEMPDVENLGKSHILQLFFINP